jgi:hypothetical protein
MVNVPKFIFKSILPPIRKNEMMKPCQSKINQSTQKRGNTTNKMEGPTSKKTKEPPKRANHKGNIKFPNPLLS